MEYFCEWRLKGDEYGGSFGNGLTLAEGESALGMKKLSENGDETVFEGKHGHTLTCIHKKTGDVTVCQTVFENTTGTTARLELLSSFAIKGIEADRIHRAISFWSAEGKLLSQDLTELDMEPSWAHHGIRVEKFGQLGSMPVRKWFPFLALENTKTGEFIGVQLYCASSWQMEIVRKYETVFIQGGLADRDFGAWEKDVAPGESFVTPKAVVATGKSLYEVCDKLVKAQKPRIAEADKSMPVIFNEYCASWGNPTLENLKKTADSLKGSGVKYLVIDCGWYKPDGCEDWFNASGDWIPSKKLFPDGIKEAADMIKDAGFIPGIWFEAETVGNLSDAYNDTEHLLKRDGCPVTVGGRRFWDFRDKYVWDYLDKRLVSFLKDNGFGYLKIDYNENIGVGVDGAESYGEGLRQTVEKSREFIKHITDELPSLVVENCSSGGHRLEPSMMELVSQASFSDAHECESIPLIAANLHRLIRPEQSQIWAVLRKDADIHRINFLLTGGFLGRLCLSGEISELDEKNRAAVLDAIKFYDKIKEIIRDGFTAEIRSDVKDYSNPEGYQAVLRTLGDSALLIVHTFKNTANPPINDLLDGYRIADAFGSELDGELRGKAFLLKKQREE
jgi:alpha-galactosidase